VWLKRSGPFNSRGPSGNGTILLGKAELRVGMVALRLRCTRSPVKVVASFPELTDRAPLALVVEEELKSLAISC
jgi:hypothetical protein